MMVKATFLNSDTLERHKKSVRKYFRGFNAKLVGL